MAAKDEGTFGSLFGKAKKWVENEVATSGDPMKDHGRSEANEGLEADMRLEAQRARDRTLADVIVPMPNGGPESVAIDWDAAVAETTKK